MENTPSEEIFEDIKLMSIFIWKGYDNKYGYVDEKLDMIRSIKNRGDAVMAMYHMFDPSNKRRLKNLVSEQSLKYIKDNE